MGKRYGEIVVGPNYTYVLFKEFPLPQGWNRTVTPLLIMMPAGYPATKLDNFYVTAGFRLATGTMPTSYSEPQRQFDQDWGAFSVHPDEWRPTDTIVDGDWLASYIFSTVTGRLRELN